MFARDGSGSGSGSKKCIYIPIMECHRPQVMELLILLTQTGYVNRIRYQYAGIQRSQGVKSGQCVCPDNVELHSGHMP